MLIKIIKGVLIVWCVLNGVGEFGRVLDHKPKASTMRFWDLFWTVCYILVILFLMGVLK